MTNDQLVFFFCILESKYLKAIFSTALKYNVVEQLYQNISIII